MNIRASVLVLSALAFLASAIYISHPHKTKLRGDSVVTSSPENRLRPPIESDFRSAPYMAAQHGLLSLIVRAYDFNHNDTGRQGILAEAQINHLQPDDGRPSGYYFFIYNPRIHKSDDGSADCDLGKMLTDPAQHAYESLMFMASGEGFITDDDIGRENGDYNGTYPGKGCQFVLTGVHTRGIIPEDVWDRADSMWRQESKKLAVAATTNEEKPQTETAGQTAPTVESGTSGEPPKAP